MEEKYIELRSVIKFLWLNHYSNQDITAKLHETYGEGCITERNVQKHTKELREGKFSIFDKERSGRPEITELDARISQIMEDEPYIKTSELAKMCAVNKETIKHILRDHLHMIKVNFKWIPHQLTDSLRRRRVETAKEMLQVLENRSPQFLRKVYTEDETWIYFDNPRRSMWVLNGDQIPTCPKQTIASKKVMIAVTWSPAGILSITPLRHDQTFDRDFFLHTVIDDLFTVLKPRGKILHCDNARPHLIDDELAEMGVKRLPHPPYSPDLAPSDFFLFGYLKFKLEGKTFHKEDEVLGEVARILHSIPKCEFQAAYDEWINRLHMCIERDGEYIH